MIRSAKIGKYAVSSAANEVVSKHLQLSSTLLVLVAVSLFGFGLPAHKAHAAASCPALLDHSFPRLQDEAPQSLCQYAGKVVLVVNTASYCGFTSQYKALEELYAKRQKDGLVVLGFPSNDFGAQEPGSNKQIAEFCTNTFGVKFPMFAKTSVTKPKPNPFYAQLADKTGATPKWNFHKYLIGRDGNTVASYGSNTAPDDKAFLAEVNKLLDAKTGNN